MSFTFIHTVNFVSFIGYIRGAYKEDMSRAMKLVQEQKKKKRQFSMLALKKIDWYTEEMLSSFSILRK